MPWCRICGTSNHNSHVNHCEGAVLRIYAADEWSNPFEERTPILVLEGSEASAIAAFLNYWTDARTGEPITQLAMWRLNTIGNLVISNRGGQSAQRLAL